jgi:hypothetical protein
LLFEAGGFPLGVFVAEVTKLLLEGEDALLPVPFAHPAMAGLLDSEAVGALPVFDLVGILDPHVRPPVSAPGATVAVFSTERGPVGLRSARRGTAQEYRYLDDFQEEAERLDELPMPLRSLVMGVGELSDGLFYFFSPEAFVMSLESYAAASARRTEDAGDRA